MTARKSGSRLETEIERSQLVRQLSAKLISNDLGNLLLGEAKLQQYLKKNPIKQGASPRGPRPQLVEVRKHLTAALDRGNLKVDSEAFNQYGKVTLDELALVGAPVYRLSMIAEAYATKGLCLEKVPAASPSLSNYNVDKDQEVITCYEKSGDIALLYLKEVEKISALIACIRNGSATKRPPLITVKRSLKHFCEQAFLIDLAGVSWNDIDLIPNLTQGVGRFREILRAVETRTTQNLRMTIAKQLAEILLRGMCEQSYWSSLEDPPSKSHLDDPLLCQGAPYLKDYALSRRPRVYTGENLFCPQENTEEALLLLLISESMANRDAVLSRIPEHNSDRIISLQSASVVYDLLTIALGRRGQYEMLSESARAVKVLKECIRLKPDDPTIPLLAVKLCIGAPHWLEEGECFAKMVVDMGEKASEFRAKGYLAIGLVYSLKATDGEGLFPTGMQEEYQKKALGAFQRAQSLSPTDHLAAFYLALELAKHYHNALNIIEMALSEYPESFILLFTKVKLETLCQGPEEALDSGRGSSLLDRAIVDRRTLNAMTLPDFSDPETGSVHTTSMAASRVEQALSEVASSMQSSTPKQGPLHPWMTLAQIWLHAVEVYIGMGKPAEATACTQEAANLFPMSHNVLFTRGQVAELRGNVDEAKRWYEEALSISPTHVKTMQRLQSLELGLRKSSSFA
uniref:Tetratricopeptide repeat domain 7B n=1 Tax=Oncorhynchus kisutch TaxID=8019 RepID=A0A8C7H1V7_ONCKI